MQVPYYFLLLLNIPIKIQNIRNNIANGGNTIKKNKNTINAKHPINHSPFYKISTFSINLTPVLSKYNVYQVSFLYTLFLF